MFSRRIGVALGASALILTLGAPAAQAADSSTHGITVQATGTIKVIPDAVRINLTSTTIGATSKEALAATAKTSDSIRKVLAGGVHRHALPGGECQHHVAGWHCDRHWSHGRCRRRDDRA